MISKLKNHFSKLSNKINEKMNITQDLFKNAVLSILIIGGAGTVTKAESNIQNISKINSNTEYTVQKNDTLYKISIKYGIKVSQLKKINNIGDDNIIHLGETLLIQKKKTIVKNNENKRTIVKNNTIEKKEEKSKITHSQNIHLKVIKYSKMYHKVGNKYKGFYTISPSDTALFTGNIKQLNGKQYVEMRLSNDGDKIGYVRVSTFDSKGQELIKNGNKKTKKNNFIVKTKINPQVKHNKSTVKVVKQSSTHLKELFKAKSEKVVDNTVKWAWNKKNKIHIDSSHVITLSNKLNIVQLTLNKILNDTQKRAYLMILIKSIKTSAKDRSTLDNFNLIELFDEYATLKRKQVSKDYYAKLSYEEIYKSHIEKDFGGDWNIGIKKINETLGLDKSILSYNLVVKSTLNKLRNEGVNKLLEFISQTEGTDGNYNAVIGIPDQNKIDYTQMTIAEVIEDQRKRINKGLRLKGFGLSATGKYQFIRKTLKEIVIRDHIDINKQKYSKQFQDKIAKLELHYKGLDDYINGKIHRDVFQKNVSKVWASLPKDESGESHYKGDGRNRAFATNVEFDNILDNLKNPKPKKNIFITRL